MAIFKSRETRKIIKLLKKERKRLKKVLNEASNEMEDVVINYQREKKINKNYGILISETKSNELVTNLSSKVKASDTQIKKIQRKIVKQDEKITNLKTDIETINKTLKDLRKN
jgi:hypothetical protein